MKKLYKVSLFLFASFVLVASNAALGQASKASADRVQMALMKAAEPLQVLQKRHLRTAALLAQVSERSTFTWESGDWQPETRTAFSFAGEISVREETEEWTGSAWVKSELYVSMVSGGKVVEETYYGWPQGASDWLPEFQTVIEYGAGGDVPTKVTYREWNAELGAFVDVDRTTYTIDSGVWTAYTTELFENGEWVLSDRMLATQEGSMLTLTFQIWESDAWVNQDRFVFPDFSLQQVWQGVSGENEVSEEFFEDFLGFWNTNFLIQEWIDGDWMDVTRFVSESEIDGVRLVRRIGTYQEWAEDFEGGFSWVDALRTTTEFERVGTVDRPTISKTEFAEEDDEGEMGWLTWSQSSYEYDNDGNLSVVTQQAISFFTFVLENSRQTRYKWAGVGTDVTADPVPSHFGLLAAYPNPFNPATQVTFRLEDAATVAVRVFDMMGREVATLANGLRTAGEHTVRFSADGLAGGTYMIRLEAPDFQQTRSVVLLK